ncbi:MAG: META domain-containing protein [Geminicoccaceae bacterium]
MAADPARRRTLKAAAWRQAPGLVFDGSGRFAGSGGCNRVMGGYTLDGDTIAFGAVAGTMMFCNGLMETEQAMTAALGAARGWRVLGRQLDLMDDEGTLLARFTAD